MRIRPLHATLLTLSLLLGQWAAIAHSAEHSLQGDNLHVCKTCLQYQNLGSPAPVSAAAELAQPVPVEAQFVVLQSHPVVACRTAYQSRAPPRLI